MNQPTPLRQQIVVTEYLPAVHMARHATALDAFRAVGCPESLAVRAAFEVDATGCCSAVAAVAVAPGHASFASVRFDPAGTELAAVLPETSGGVALYLAAPAFGEADPAVAMAQAAEAARLTGRHWMVIQRERIQGFGPRGWEA